MGGIGNNLFQIFFGHILEKQGYYCIYINSLVKKNLITKLLGWKIHQDVYSFFLSHNQKTNYNLFPLIFGLLSKKFNRSVIKAKYVKDISELNIEADSHYFGYFQDKFFLRSHQKDFLVFCKSINQLVLRNENKDSSETVIHFRGGDSLWAKQNLSYYQSVKEIIKNLAEVLIVTDDLFGAKQFFGKSKNLKFIKSSLPIDDFKILLTAKNLYCAPSTFSWWAAHCANDANIIAPEFLDETIGFYLPKKNLTLLK